MKVVVFDLDGTLWYVNSHIEILNEHFNTRAFSSVFAKAFARVCPKLFQCLINKLYSKYINEEDLVKFKPKFRDTAIDILNEQIGKADRIMIISNAPCEILNIAKARLNLEGYSAPIGKKHEVLMQVCPKIVELTVVTDNLSDKELIKIANRKILYAKDRAKKKFLDMGFSDAEFMEYEEGR